MRIDSNQALPQLPESGRSSNPNPASADSRASGTSVPGNVLGGVLGEDQAQLSGGQVQVQALAAQALQFPEVRQEKVNSLRQSILDGRYQAGSNQVAEALFAHLLVAPAA
jgi:flagellar biosynthesis anti-sigma factor FlgM